MVNNRCGGRSKLAPSRSTTAQKASNDAGIPAVSWNRRLTSFVLTRPPIVATEGGIADGPTAQDNCCCARPGWLSADVPRDHRRGAPVLSQGLPHDLSPSPQARRLPQGHVPPS